LSVYFETEQDEFSKGYSTNYCLVYAVAPLYTVCNVKIKKLVDDALIGEIV